MTIQTETMSETSLESAVAPAALSPTRPLYWSMRRELWENRSLYIAPLIVAALALVSFAISAVRLAQNRRLILALDPVKRAAVVAISYDLAAMAIMVTAGIVAVFYCLGALHNERRDRSILFWKSLPVSDLTAVLAKLSMPLLVLPLIAFAVAVVLQLTMLALGSIILLANGLNPMTPPLPLPQMWLVLLYSLAVISLWYAPIWGWLLMVSAWARRTPFLWAFLPPLALCLVERMAFNTGHFASLLNYRLGGFSEAFALAPTAGMHGVPPQIGLAQLDPTRFLSDPGLWVGLLFAAAFLAAAVWLRRRGDPI